MGDVSKHFSRREFMCHCGCGFATVDVDLISVLEDLRVHFDSPILITSGCRCASHNRRVGGAPDSEHLRGTAADIKVDGVASHTVYDYLTKKYPGKYGLGRYPTWTHVDVRLRAARWVK